MGWFGTVQLDKLGSANMSDGLEESGTKVVGGGGRHPELPEGICVLKIPTLIDIVEIGDEE